MNNIFFCKRQKNGIPVLFALALLFCVFTTGCVRLNRCDITNNSIYKSYVGDIYRTQKEMKLMGIRLERTKEKIDYYQIVSLPGVGGPEFEQIDNLPAGTTLQITRILRKSPKLPFTQDIFFIAKVLSDYQFKGREVDIYPAFGTYIKVPGEDIYTLNPEHFERITHFQESKHESKE